MSYVIKNINIISMTNDQILYNHDVRISDDRIVEINKNISSDHTIDGSGKYLIPGLADMHYHTEGKSEDEMELLIAYGVTSIRIVWGSESALELKAKQNIKEFIVPHVYISSEILDGNPPVFEGMRVVETVEDARQAVIEAKEKGYDFIKVYNNLLMPQYQEIIKTAKELNMDVVGHVPVDVGAEKAIEYGQYGFEHAKALPRHLLSKAAKAGVYFDPTLITMKVIDRIKKGKISDDMYVKGVAEYVDADTVAAWKEAVKFFEPYDFKLDRTYHEYVADIKVFHDAGGRLLTGTDTPMPFCVPGISLHEEMKIFAESGLDNYEILKAATINAAQSNHVSDDIGTIEKEKLASLVVLNSNPLENIVNTLDIEAVVLKGKYFDRESLNHMLSKIEEICKRSKETIE